MPTGYTAGILDGDIKDFKQFAKLCIRNFGATIHMRDDPMYAEYVPREPSDYHLKAIKEANKLLSDSQSLSDNEIVSIRRAELLKDKMYHQEAISKEEKNADKLQEFLKDARAYVPPTEQHKGIKDFMIEQLTSTISFDCNTSYHAEKLVSIEKELETLDAKSIRISMLEKAAKDLRYHQDEYDKDVKRCQESNEWVMKFLNSL